MSRAWIPARASEWGRTYRFLSTRTTSTCSRSKATRRPFADCPAPVDSGDQGGALETDVKAHLAGGEAAACHYQNPLSEYEENPPMKKQTLWTLISLGLIAAVAVAGCAPQATATPAPAIVQPTSPPAAQ